MNAILALLPVFLQLAQNPDIQKILPLLAQLGAHAFPAAGDPQAAGASLFDHNDTEWVQTALNLLGNKLTVDGVPAEATKAAVSAFQETHHLTIDGWAGKDTQKALRDALSQLKMALP